MEGRDRKLRRFDHLVLLRGGEKKLQGLVKRGRNRLGIQRLETTGEYTPRKKN